MTRIAVEVPEDIAKPLESAWRDVSRGTLEALALKGYRDGTLSEQVGGILGLSFGESEAFLTLAREVVIAADAPPSAWALEALPVHNLRDAIRLAPDAPVLY